MIENTTQIITFFKRHDNFLNEEFDGFNNFIVRFRNLKSRIEKYKIEYLTDVGTTFFENIRELTYEYEKENESLAEKYNIFSILKFNRPEENLHSPVLCSFLDCNGKHGQKDLFYKLFLNELFIETNNVNRFVNENYKDYYSNLEEFVSSNGKTGRIDLYIKSLNPSKKFAVILENKWDSPDSGFDQIYKYYKGLKEIGYLDEDILIIYLTTSDNDPDQISEEFKELLNRKRDKTYFSISYSKEIVQWLNQSLGKVKSDKIKVIIEQYIELLQRN